MTKTQVKSKLRKLLEQLGDIRAELEDLQYEVEDTKDSIEPYEGCNELSAEQEERQEWFEEAYYAIENAVECLQSSEIDELESMVD